MFGKDKVKGKWNWGDHVLPIVSKCTYLGVDFSYNGAWDTHIINKLIQNGQQKVNQLNSIISNHYINLSAQRMLLLSVLRPSLEYGIQALERVQTFAARLVTNDWAGNGESLRALLGWPKLSTRRQFQKLCLCRRIVTGGSLIPPCFFEPHPRPTNSHRNSSPLFRPYVRTLQHRHSFKHSVVDVWNGIPEDTVSSSQTVRSFKAKLRELLFT